MLLKVGDSVQRTEANIFARGRVEFSNGKSTAKIVAFKGARVGDSWEIAVLDTGKQIPVKDLELVIPAPEPNPALVKAAEQYGTVGKKFDDGKAPIMQGLFRYFPRALKEVALQSQYGHVKYDVPYDEENWEKLTDGWNRYGDALGRHFLDLFIDGEVDPGTGEFTRTHMAAIAWNALAWLELDLRGKENVSKTS